MNRAARLLELKKRQELEEWVLMTRAFRDRIEKMGPDRWLKSVWGLTGSAAESAWWGILSLIDKPKKRRT